MRGTLPRAPCSKPGGTSLRNLRRNAQSEDQVIAAVAFAQGGWLFLMVLFRNPSNKRTSLHPRIDYEEASVATPEAAVEASGGEREENGDVNTTMTEGEENEEALRHRAPHAAGAGSSD